MPHSIIHKLNALCAMDFPSKLESGEPRLDKAIDLPEGALDLVDAVLDDASRILGAGQRPSAHQIRVFADAGYKLSHDGLVRGAAWSTGVIHTPKGTINYW